MGKPWDEKLNMKVLAVLDSRKNMRNLTQIRVVEWAGDKGTYIMVEKRDVYFDSEGVEKPGKCRGFNLKDYQLIEAKRDEIMPLLMGRSRDVKVAVDSPGDIVDN